MKVVFVSNYFNHHQKAFSDALKCYEDVEYYFISTIPMREERKKLGYAENDLPNYVLCSYCGNGTNEKAQNLINTADIVIAGSAPEKMLRHRIKSGKIVFRYSERPLKNDISFVEYLKFLIKWHIKNPVSKPIYLLCASAYAYCDYKKFYLFKNKAFKWGYFPETNCYKDIDALLRHKKKNVILWCGRFLDWKHPEYALEIAKRLKKENIEFELRYIGTGEEEKNLVNLVKEYGLEKNVTFWGSMSTECVRMHMEEAAIFLFTSNKQEGWGAVLNEAMNSACAVVASNAAGATPYLVNDGKNGLIFEADNQGMLYNNVKLLLGNHELQEKLGKEAYYTIIEQWNARIGAERLLQLMNKILNDESGLDLFESGPCSRADK